MSELETLKSHALAMADRAHASNCPAKAIQPTGVRGARCEAALSETSHEPHRWSLPLTNARDSIMLTRWCPGHCTGCMTDTERVLWRQAVRDHLRHAGHRHQHPRRAREGADMRSEGIRGSYVAATSGIPLPQRSLQGTPTVGLVTCARCPMRIRPGAFHICLEPNDADPATPQTPKADKKPPPDERTRRHEVRAVLPAAPRCKCGKRVDRGVRQCRDCFTESHPKPDCGTVQGYRWHRRQARMNPGPSNPWPLPKADVCGCRAAQAEHSRQRREST